MRYIIAFILILAAFFVIVMVIDNNRFVVREYAVSSPRIRSPLRIVFIADLHEKSYGADNEKLIARIRELNPDLILIGGDLIVSADVFDHYRKMEKAGGSLDKDDRSWMPASYSFARRIAGYSCPAFAAVSLPVDSSRMPSQTVTNISALLCAQSS